MAGSAAPTREGRMIAACYGGDLAAVRTLLTQDSGLARVRDEELESTPLHLSAHRGHVGIVEALLAAGAEVDAREGCSGATALHWAAEGGHPDVALRLLAAGAAPGARDDWHELGPHDWAVFVVHAPHNHADRGAVEALLEARGWRPSIFAQLARRRAAAVRQVAAQDPAALQARLGPVDGQATPLVFSVERGAADMVALLLELGADPDGASAGGLSALALARLRGDEACEERLLARGARPDLSYLVVCSDEQQARAVLHAEPGAIGPDGRYAALLHAVALHGLVGATRLLLEQGADPNATHVCLGVDEWLAELPPLFLAAGKGCTSVAGELVRHGADVNAPAMRARLTPLHVAAFRGWLPMVQMLLDAGADPRAADVRQQHTPADWARQAGREEVAALIERAAARPAQA